MLKTQNNLSLPTMLCIKHFMFTTVYHNVAGIGL